MLLTLALIFFVWSIADGYEARAMRRHNESIREQRRLREAQEAREREDHKRALEQKKKVTRTLVRDESGRFVAQETVEDL